MFRRPRLRFAGAQQILGPVEMAQLQDANRLMAKGEPAKAAVIFVRLAQELQSTQHPRKSANFHAQAAHAFADAGNEDAALQQAQVALRFFLRLGMNMRAPHFFTNIRNKFKQQGMEKSATTLETEFGDRVSSLPKVPGGPTPVQRHLPTSCPKCGAPLRSDEVEWVDQATVACSYCGTLISS